MAGTGLRFKLEGYLKPKPLIEIENTTMIQRVVNSLDINGNYIFVIQKSHNILKILENIYPNSRIIEIDYVTEGPACTSLLAKEYINNDTPLLIANCDQIMWWNSEHAEMFFKKCSYDGVVVTYTESTIKNSYAKVDRNGYVLKISEKEVISNISLNGIHFWKKGSHFVKSTEQMIKDNERYNNEFYVGPSYNSLIKMGKQVGIYHIPNEQHHAVGTPNDLLKYIEKVKNEIN
jgi:choline kinase